MHTFYVNVIFYLVFGAWLRHGSSSLQVTPISTQEDFNLDQFLGQWFEVAVVSTCPHFMQRKMRSPTIVKLNLQHSDTQGNITVTATTFRNELCKSTFTNYSLTDTAGRFFYHVPKFSADVDVNVADTNYVEYAQMVLLSTEQPEGNKTLIVKLYSRSKDVSEAMMENFKTLVRQYGIDEKTIIKNQDRGQC